MVKKTLELGEQPQVIVEHVVGNLNVKGWKRNEILLKTSCQDEIRFEESGDSVFIECPEDCILYTPHGAAIEVNQVGGGAGFKSLAGKLKIIQVGGQLSLRDVGSVDAKSIGAGLTAKGIRGDLVVESISGAANARDVDGQFHCDSVGGSLRLRDISGGISVSAGGDARVEISPVPWQAYAITAGGNIRMNVPEDLNAEVTFSSGAQSIIIKLPNQSLRIKEETHRQEFGEGGTPISLKAGGQIHLVGLSSDWEASDDATADIDIDLGENISNMVEDITRQTTEQINAHLGELDSHLSELSTTLEQVGLSEERSQEIQQRLDQARQRATQRAEEAARRAQGKLERKLAAAQRKVTRKARQAHKKAISIDVDAIRASRDKSSDPVSDEERMLILQMLQDGKVSVDQAEELLAALDGK